MNVSSIAAADLERVALSTDLAVDAFVNLGTPVYQGIVLAGLGRCDEADGDTAAALIRYQKALEVGRRLGEPAITASALEGLARLAFSRDDRESAAAQLGEAAGLREKFHRPAPPHERADLEHFVQRL